MAASTAGTSGSLAVIGRLPGRPSRLGRGLAFAAFASLTVHAGVAAWVLVARPGAASTPLPYVRTRLVVAAETESAKAAPAEQARISEAAGPSPPPPPPAPPRPHTEERAEAADAGRPSALQTTPAATAHAQPPSTAAPPADTVVATPPPPAQPPTESPERRRDPSPLPPAAAQQPTPEAMPISVPTPSAAPLTGASPDPGPELVSDLYIDRPAGAGKRGGSVTLRLVLSPQGAVAQATVLRSEPAGLFDAATLKAMSTARFRPAMRGGVAVSVETVYEMEIPPAR